MLINLPLIDNYIRIIQELARSGRNKYYLYFINPLSKWSEDIPDEDLEDIMNRLEKGPLTDPGEISYLYKRAIIKSVAPEQFDLSVPGNISIKFLKMMKKNETVAQCEESSQFVSILNEPFRKYFKEVYKIINERFQNEINSADTTEVEEYVKAAKKPETFQEILQKQSKLKVNEIKNKLTELSSLEMKKIFIDYLLKFSTPSIPDLHKGIFSLIKDMEIIKPGLTKEIMDTTAVIIYHEIVKAVRARNVKKAVLFISKYTVLFRGNPDTPNYHEVDSFERMFFDMLERRKMWDII